MWYICLIKLNFFFALQIRKLLQQLETIYTNAKLEIVSKGEINVIPNITNFSIFENYTFIDRFRFICKTQPINLMIDIFAAVSYKKGCGLKRRHIEDLEIDPTCSDSTTYFNDTYSCSDTESEDSGSLLGILFKENSKADDSNSHLVLSVEAKKKNIKFSLKNELSEFYNLCIELYDLSTKFVETPANTQNEINLIKINNMQMRSVAITLKDLDYEINNNDNSQHDVDYVNSGVLLLKTANSLSGYLHNLLCNGYLNEHMQHHLLLQLDISPWKPEPSDWCLNISPRLLTILVQVLTLKSQQEKEAACLSVWHRMIESMIEKICSELPIIDEKDNVNIEHAQILLYIFHSLNLMQKKSILLLIAGAVIRSAELGRLNVVIHPPNEEKIILLSRLLLFLEYMMKFLYTPPNILMEQVELILFKNLRTDPELNSSNEQCSKEQKRLYSIVKSDSLTETDLELKLDGLAWNFILCTPEKLKYPLLLDALVDIFSLIDVCRSSSSDPSTLEVVQYTVTLCWKLLLGLPPSITHIEDLMSNQPLNIYTLLWRIRCAFPATQTKYLVVNSLVKQVRIS